MKRAWMLPLTIFGSLLLAALLYLAAAQWLPFRWDLTASRENTLAPATRALALRLERELPQRGEKIRMLAFFDAAPTDPEARLREIQLLRLLEELHRQAPRALRPPEDLDLQRDGVRATAYGV